LRGFLDLLDPARDRAAIVVFNSEGQLLHGLTSDRPALDAALARVEVRAQSRIDLGIAAAREELESHRRAASVPAMILLTDGRANPVGPEVAVAEAERAKRDGVVVFAIGLGDQENLDVDALRRMVTRPEYFYLSPGADDLESIYAGIALLVSCAR
jgi:Mg-chelatase subunit ChlD